MLAPNETHPPPGDVFLVFERDPLIATDLEQALRGIGQCWVVAVRDPDHLRDALDGLPFLSAAFLEMDVGAFLASWLEEAMAARGGVPIFTRGEDDSEHGEHIRARGSGLLRRPFTEDMVLEALAPLMQRR